MNAQFTELQQGKKFLFRNLNTLGVPLRVGLFAIMACLAGQAISAAIPNAKGQPI
jgi:putative effector of murein hydrolase LrgA (UPF0299 family)